MKPTSALAGRDRRRAPLVAVGVVIAVAIAMSSASAATKSGTATGQPFKGPDSALKPFKPSNKVGEKPTDLPRVAAWEAQSSAPFWLQYANGIKKGLAGSGIKLVTGNANSDPTKAVNDLRSFLQRGVGGLVTVPVGGNEPLVPIHKEALDKGAVVIGELAGPADQIIAVDQFKVGFVQGKDAADWIKKNMGGKANVLYFNADNVSPLLIPRKLGAVAGLATGGKGIKIISNVSITPDVTKGQKLMQTELQAHPEINVVLGDDESVLGAVHAYQIQNKIGDLKFASGVDGAPDALAHIKAGNTPYKVDYGFNYGVIGIVTGQSIKRWFEGRNISQIVSVRPFPMRSAADIALYARAASNPTAADVPKFIEQFGSVSYGTRGSYVDYTPFTSKK